MTPPPPTHTHTTNPFFKTKSAGAGHVNDLDSSPHNLQENAITGLQTTK
jgi:hypothetical protein